MKIDEKFVVIRPPTRIKYKRFCKNIYKKYNKHYISYSDLGKPILNISLLMEILVNKLKPKINTSFVRNKKYEEIDFINGIIDVIQNNTYWTRYKGKVPGKYLNKRHNQYCDWNVYECLLRIVLLSYYSTNKFNKLHYQSIDCTFITNLYGSEIYGRNSKYKFKNGINMSFIVDAQGQPISVGINPGNEHDSIIVKEQLSTEFFVDTDTKSVKNNNKYQQCMIGDSAYHSKEIYDILKRKGYKISTDINFRNTKDENKRKELEKMKKRYEKKYQNKRMKVEHCNSWIKKYPKLSRLTEKSIKSFTGLLLLGISLLAKGKIK